MTWSRRAALVSLLLAGGCSGAARKHEAFPIGLFNVADPAHLTRIREAGFDHVFAIGTPAQEEAVALEAGRQGLRVVASPSVARGPDRVKRWPVAAWYLQDEPDVNNVSPEKLSEIATTVRAWDSRPQTFTVGQGSEAKRYGGIGDVFMLDWYPVPHLALDSVADQIDAALRDLPPGKPLWFVAQAFDWRDDNKKIGRFPTRGEMRFMSWLAVMHGVKGLWFFRFPRPNGATLFDFPELWGALELVARELKAFQPILEGGTLAPLPFAPSTEGLESKCWIFQGRRYVLTLNRSGKRYYRLPDELLKPEWRLFSQPYREMNEQLKAHGGAWYVRSYEALVFQGPL